MQALPSLQERFIPTRKPPVAGAALEQPLSASVTRVLKLTQTWPTALPALTANASCKTEGISSASQGVLQGICDMPQPDSP